MGRASGQGDQYTIRIEGDVTGSVVASSIDRVDVSAAPPGRPVAGVVQENTARDRGTAYSVQDGTMHVHHHDG